MSWIKLWNDTEGVHYSWWTPIDADALVEHFPLPSRQDMRQWMEEIEEIINNT